MKRFAGALFVLFISGCQIDPYTHAPTWTATDWYSAGIKMRFQALPSKITKHWLTPGTILTWSERNILRAMPKANEKPAS